MKKNFKVLSLIAIGSALCLGVTALAISNPGVLSSQFLYRKEANVSAGTIVFDKSNTTRSGTKTTTPSKTLGGDDIICKITQVDATQSDNHMGALTVGSEIHFYEADGVTEYMFEDIDRIKLEFVTQSPEFYLKGFYADGSEINILKQNGAATRDLSFISLANVCNLWIEVTAFPQTLNKLTLTYNCESKSQTSAEISTPATTLTYTEGQSFDPTGMVVKAIYNNGMKLPTSNYRITPSGALTTSDTYVSIECGGYVLQQPITVEAASSEGIHAVGLYKVNLFAGYIRLDEDGTGENYADAGSCKFNWTYDGTTLTLTAASVQTFAGTVFHKASSVTSTGITRDSNDDITQFTMKYNGNWGDSSGTWKRQAS